MTLDDLTKSSGEWLRGTGPESDIVMCSRIRLARNLADFPFTNRASRSEKAEIEAHFSSALAARQARADLPRRQRPLHARPPVPGRAPDHLPRARQQRRAPRRRHQPAGKRRDHGQRGGPSSGPVHVLGLPAPRGLGRGQSARRPARGTARLRLQPAARLPDRLPDQRRHRHPRRRDAPPARTGADQADRQGLPRPPEDQPGRPRPLRRGEPGLRRLLPDLQPADPGQERARADQDPDRRRPPGPPVRAGGPPGPADRSGGSTSTTRSAGPTACSRPPRRSRAKKRCSCCPASGWESTWA